MRNRETFTLVNRNHLATSTSHIYSNIVRFINKLSPIILVSSIMVFDFIIKKIIFTENVLLKKDNKNYEVELIEKKILNKDTRIFKFKLDNPNQKLGISIGQCIRLIAEIDSKTVIRPYTPITKQDEKGYFDVLIKVYFKNVHPSYPKGGKMTQYLETLTLGEKIKVNGPAGKIFYQGKGQFKVGKKEDAKLYKFNNLGLIAGGSGITPIYQLIQAIASDENDTTVCYLIFANHTEEDILLREEIEQFASKYPNKIKFWYTISKSKPDWKYSTGHINKEMLQKHLPPPDHTTGIFMCGPNPMIQLAVEPNLKALGFDEATFFKY